jgi:hypothetical protein
MFNTAFSFTKSKWNRWPIIETEDVSDLSQIKKYCGQYPYVWLKDIRYDILETFNWNFYPDDSNKNKIHSFPLCLSKNKKPVRWDVLCLVPTNATDSTEVQHCPYIASYQQKIKPPVYIYTFSDKNAIKKYNNFNLPDHAVHLINNKQSMSRVYSLLNGSNPMWLIDSDVTINNVNDLAFTRSDADIFMFNVLHKSTGTIYADESVQFINPSYLEILKGNTKRIPVIKKIDTVIGTINDVENPFKAWARAYYTFMFLSETEIPHLKRKKNSILGKYVSLTGSRLNTLAQSGVEEAEKFRSSEEYGYNKILDWDILEKRFKNYIQSSEPQSENHSVLEKRLEKIKKLYGTDSEQHQKLSSQFERSVGSR